MRRRAPRRPGVARVVAGQLDPNPEHGGGLERLREAGVDVELADGELGFRCRQQIEEWRTWVTTGRPFVTYKVAVTLDGRVRVPGLALGDRRGRRAGSSTCCARSRTPSRSGWARCAGTTRGSTRATSRRVGQPRRIAFGRGPLPDGSELELRRGRCARSSSSSPPTASSRCSSKAGPTLAAAFLERGLVDKLLVFVAPRSPARGRGCSGAAAARSSSRGMEARRSATTS